MKRIWLVIAGLVMVLAVLALAGCTAQGSPLAGGNFRINVNSQQEGIWVTGEGEVTVVPDIAILRLGIESQEATVASAQAQAIEAMNKVMAVLTDNGVAKKDIQTQNFSIQRVTRWDERGQREIVIGYRVTNVVVAKIRQMDKVGTVIDAVAAAGGDLTRIDGISFSVDKPETYYEEVRQKAMTDARAKAEQLAKLSGVTLGKPTFISESFQQPPIIRMEKAMAGASAQAPTPISPGEMEIRLSVQVTYAILN